MNGVPRPFLDESLDRRPGRGLTGARDFVLRQSEDLGGAVATSLPATPGSRLVGRRIGWPQEATSDGCDAVPPVALEVGGREGVDVII